MTDVKTKLPPARQTPFFFRLYDEIERQGGLFNAHLHLDRAGTLDTPYQVSDDFNSFNASYISLHEKHHHIYDIHAGPAYEPDDLARRVNHFIDVMIDAGTARGDTLVDVTPDRVGLSALETMMAVKAQRSDEFDLRVGAYTPLGFRDDEPHRWQLIEDAAYQADFLGFLPEADDTSEYPAHIGFGEHCRRALELAAKHQKPIHVHTDQRNEPSEHGTEKLLGAIQAFGAPQQDSGEPMIWAVHMISPTTYTDDRFQKLVDSLVAFNVGVICCPSAALGMRQLRQIKTPTDNSMPRVLELLAAGVNVRIASDNIADMCSPSTTADLVDEVLILSAALRFYQPEILGKLAAGASLNDADRQFIKDHLAYNAEEAKKTVCSLNGDAIETVNFNSKAKA